MAHIYKSKDGRILPSVTRVTRDMLPSDYIKFFNAKCRRKGLDPEKELERLGNIGTICHYRVLSKISPTPIDLPDIPAKDYPKDAMERADVFEMMWDDLNLTIHQPICEKFNYSEDYGYCGTYDLAAIVSGVIGDKRPEGRGRKVYLDESKCLIDLKTSADVKEGYYYQLGAYSLFTPFVPDYGIVVCMHPWVTPKRKYLIAMCYVLDRNELMGYKQKFLNLLSDWWQINGKAFQKEQELKNKFR